MRHRIAKIISLAGVLEVPVVDNGNVRPDVLDRDARHLVEISLVLRHGTGPGLDDAALSIQFLHPLPLVAPVALHAEAISGADGSSSARLRSATTTTTATAPGSRC